ncbi:MAG TPA: hypothetical protein VNC50_03195, partial [Planctomycetia bacterium]|nr:hypothetical protein [Planctomycetia bacterium]
MSPPERTSLLPRAALALVVLFACWQTIYLGLAFARDPDTRFASLEGDRNNHYALALRMAQCLQSGDVGGYLKAIESTHSQWPPLHGVLLSPVLALTGASHAYAATINLLAYGGTIVVAYLLVLRLAPASGVWGGMLAALLVGLSPAFRIFAADVMLESLGAFLTLTCFWAYVRWRQAPSVANARWTAFALTLLFFEKYNYWLLALLGLALAEFIARRREIARIAVSAVRSPALPSWLRQQALHPLNWLVLGYAGLLVAALRNGPIEVPLGRASFRFSASGHMAVYVLYLLALARLGWEWRRELGPFFARAPRDVGIFARWHVAPVMVSFLLPGRLFYFLWYNSPANSSAPAANLARQAAAYRDFLVSDYFTAAWVAAAAATLLVAGVLLARKRRGALLAVAVAFALATGLTIKHPNVKSRHVHSWITLGWVLC